MYYVIHSENPYLLARFCTELQMEGWEYPKYWEEHGYHPFGDGFSRYEWIALNFPINQIKAHNHACNGNPTRFTLTSGNYTEVLEAVLNNKTK